MREKSSGSNFMMRGREPLIRWGRALLQALGADFNAGE
jgi:hypothetical protein